MKMNNTGFTIIELIIYVAIVSVVLGVAVTLGITVIQQQARSAAMQSVTENGRFVLDRITTLARNATQIDTGQSVFGVSPGTLVLILPDDDDGDEDDEQFVIDVGGGALRVAQDGATPLSLTSNDVNVASFVLTYLTPSDGPPGVVIDVTLERVNPSGLPSLAVSQRFVTSVILRQNSP